MAGYSLAQKDNTHRINNLEETCEHLDEEYMPRGELDTNFKLFTEQLNRVEQKTDMTNEDLKELKQIIIKFGDRK